MIKVCKSQGQIVTLKKSNSAYTILVVDDSESERFFYVNTFMDAGYRVREASSGTESLLKLEPRPDLILLNVKLPDISGYEICKQLKKSHLSSIPIIQVSASFSSREEADKSQRSGADAYLASPIESSVLLEKIYNCLKKADDYPR